MASPRSHIDTAIAIDLGKTYSRMGIWRGDHGRVDIIANEQGNQTTPSMVAFTNNECYIGQSAKNQAASNPANTVFGAKRLIGRRFSDPSVQADKSLWPFSIVCGPSDKLLIKVMFKGEEKMLTAEEISSMVLLKMKEVAQQYLGYPVNKAVITVPAYFNDSQRRATKDAGRMAGFDVLELLNEPTAATIAYGLDGKASSSDNGENVLIFDLGREALDVTVLTINKNKIEVKGMGIDTCLGGEDFNTRMVKHFVAKFKWISKVDISSNATALRRLRCACERAKRVLSFTAEAIVEVPCLDKSKDLVSNINRATFEEINIRLFKKCMEIVKKCLKDARLSKTQIDKVVLVGGSTRIPKVQELLQDLFGPGKLHNTINPDEAVVVGAAVHASVLNWSHLTARDVTALSLGVGVKGDIISILIPRNTPFPVRKQRFYTTAYDNWERVAVKLYEGERPDIKHNSFLGGFSLDIPRAPRGAVSVKISMEIDANRMLKVSAEQKTSESMIIANKSGRPSDDDIAKIIAEAEKFKNEDERWKEMVELRNALDRYLYSMNKRVNKEKPKVEMERKDVQDMEAGLEETSESQNADKDEPAGIMDNIRNLCVKIEKV